MKNNAVTKTNNDNILHLFVSLPTDDVCSLRDVHTNMLVQQLKSKVELKVGIPGDLIHLFFLNIELDGEKRVDEYKLKHGCVLRVRLHKTWIGLFLACSRGDIYEVFHNGVQELDLGVTGLDVRLWNKLVVKRATFALFMATHRGYLSLVLELLKSSAADVNGVTIFGRTCLHVAAYQGFVGCVSLLLSEGAISNTTDVFGKTALQLASINKHMYCQKRLHLHQTSERGGTVSNTKERTGTTNKSVQSSSDKLLKNRQSFPKISVSEQGSSPTLESVSDESVFWTLPAVKPEQESTTNDPSEDGFLEEGTYPDTPQPELIQLTHDDFPAKLNEISDAMSLNTELRNDSDDIVPCNSATTSIMEARETCAETNYQEQRILPRNVRRIEKVLKASEDDLVGEYHNINETVANADMTTLVLTLPSNDTTDDISEEMVQTEGENEVSDTQVPDRATSHNKRILGFVLKAEQKSQETGSAHERCEDVVESLSRDNKGLDHVTWIPMSSTASGHRRLTLSLSYDEWLKKKKDCARLETKTRPKSATTQRKMEEEPPGREQAFQKWLEKKKKIHRRRASEPFVSNQRTASSGVSFETWLDQKRKQSFSLQNETVSENLAPRTKSEHLGGKTFSEWLWEKQKGRKSDEVKLKNTVNDTRRSHSGKSFKEWLKDKKKDKEKEMAGQEILEIEKLQKQAVLEERRRQNPRVKTFEKWKEEKHAQKLIESVRSNNMPDQSNVLNSDMKYPEDASLVFDMWLISKNMAELDKEQELYEEMEEKWRKKQQERLQIQKGRLQKLNQSTK